MTAPPGRRAPPPPRLARALGAVAGARVRNGSEVPLARGGGARCDPRRLRGTCGSCSRFGTRSAAAVLRSPPDGENAPLNLSPREEFTSSPPRPDQGRRAPRRSCRHRSDNARPRTSRPPRPAQSSHPRHRCAPSNSRLEHLAHEGLGRRIASVVRSGTSFTRTRMPLSMSWGPRISLSRRSSGGSSGGTRADLRLGVAEAITSGTGFEGLLTAPRPSRVVAPAVPEWETASAA